MQPVEVPQPSSAARVARRAAGVFGRLFAFGAIAAAGFGGWIAVEQFALPQLEASAAAQTAASGDATNPWPASYPAERGFESFTIAYERDGLVTHTTTFDADTKRARMTFYDGDAVDHITEVAGLEYWTSTPADPVWRQVDAGDAIRDRVLGMTRVVPVHIDDVLVAEAYPFATVTTEASAGGLDRYRVSIDAKAFRQRTPHIYEDWVRRSVALDADTMEWSIEVRPDGYIERWEGASDSVVTWSESDSTPTFESPLAPRATAPEPVAPSTDDPTAD